MNPAASQRRRLAAGPIGYGVVGVLLLAVSAPLFVGPLAALGRIAGHQGEAVRWLDLTSQSFEDAGHGSANAGASLASAAGAARNAASLAQELSTSIAALRDASGQTILGAQPFGGLTSEFGRVASRASDVAASMQSPRGDARPRHGRLRVHRGRRDVAAGAGGPAARDPVV